MMKVLHVIDSMDMGGAQSLIAELAPAQKEQGVEVAVLQLVDSVDRTFISRLEDNDIPVLSLSKQRSVRNIYNIIVLMPYLRRFDVVHVHLFPANYWVALAKMFSFSKTPIVTTEHSTDNKRRKIKIFKYIDASIYKQYHAIIACSDKAKETFEEHFKSIKCLSIPNGVNIRKYNEAQPYSKGELIGVDEGCFICTMVARFVPSKRQDVIVRAMAQLPDTFHALFVGGTENDEGLIKVRDLSKSLGVENRIHFLYLRSDVPRILKSSDVIVMSSEYEGLSLSSIEGMACGHPFVASDVNGLREVVNGAGVLVECGDVEALASVLMELKNNTGYREEIICKCEERASQYDIKKVAGKYIQLYKELLAE